MKRPVRKLFSVNRFERKILSAVFMAASIPVFLVVGFFTCVFNDLVQTHIRASLASEFLQQLFVLTVILLLYYFLFVGILAYRFAHRLVGALPRIIMELDERLEGKTKSHITVRRDDYVQELVVRVNKLLDKLP